jgi:hypothetical protein
MARSGVRILNKGHRDLRKSQMATRLVMGGTQAAADYLNSTLADGFVAEESPSANRARATVHADTAEAGVATARNPAHVIGSMAAAQKWLRANV